MSIAKKMKPSWVETFSIEHSIKSKIGRDLVSYLYPDEDLNGYWEDGVYFVYNAKINDWVPEDEIFEHGYY